MALVVLLRGVNVGGHRTFRPSLLAEELRRFDVVNVGAAGTFVVRKPGSHRAFEAALRRKLPFATAVVICDGRILLRLETDNPFGVEPPASGVVRFASFLTKGARTLPKLPIALPTADDWLVRVVGTADRVVFGEYRRHMKTIGCLGQLDKLFGGQLTTRNWTTVAQVLDILNGRAKKSARTAKNLRAGRP
jgi:uncharacterized protein (DUF1697 family)